MVSTLSFQFKYPVCSKFTCLCQDCPLVPPQSMWKEQGPAICPPKWWKAWKARLLPCLTFQCVPGILSAASRACELGSMSLGTDPAQTGECDLGKPPAITCLRHLLILGPQLRGKSPPQSLLVPSAAPQPYSRRCEPSAVFLIASHFSLSCQCGNTLVPSTGLLLVW